jgi:hypothetical protein
MRKPREKRSKICWELYSLLENSTARQKIWLAGAARSTAAVI